jgi:hypothetical protein
VRIEPLRVNQIAAVRADCERSCILNAGRRGEPPPPSSAGIETLTERDTPQLKREESLVAGFGRADGNYHNISNTWLSHGFLSSSPPASQSILCGVISRCVRTADIPAG